MEQSAHEQDEKYSDDEKVHSVGLYRHQSLSLFFYEKETTSYSDVKGSINDLQIVRVH